MKFLVLGVMLCVALMGCGGGGGGTAAKSPFANHWSGRWDDAGKSYNGHLDITVSDSGSITGTVENLTNATNGTVSGSVTNGGAISLTYTYPNNEVYTVSGNVSIHDNAYIYGESLPELLNGSQYSTVTIQVYDDGVG